MKNKEKMLYIGYNKDGIYCKKCKSKKLSFVECLKGWYCLKCGKFNNALYPGYDF